MPRTMALDSLASDLKNLLPGVATSLDTQDFKTFLHTAAADFSRHKPLIKTADLTLQSGLERYDLPADFIRFQYTTWGASRRNDNPWDKGFICAMPRMKFLVAGNIKQVHFVPAPSSAQIGSWGSLCSLQYAAHHSIAKAAEDTTLSEHYYELFLQRAQVEALKFTAIKNLNKSVAARSAVSGENKNGAPLALAAWLMDDFEKAIKCLS